MNPKLDSHTYKDRKLTKSIETGEASQKRNLKL